jgi:RNA polymerase sigma factor (sigma-70 family)
MTISATDFSLDSVEGIALLKQGNRDAWQSVHENYAERLRLDILRSLTKRSLSAVSLDDIFQEVWEVAYREIEHFEWQSPKAFYHWLRVIALIRVQKRLGYLKHQALSLEEIKADSSSSNWEYLLERIEQGRHKIELDYILQEQAAAVEQAVGRIKNTQHREIIKRWLYWEEKPRHLGKEYNIDTHTVSMICWRFIKYLKGVINQ